MITKKRFEVNKRRLAWSTSNDQSLNLNLHALFLSTDQITKSDFCTVGNAAENIMVVVFIHHRKIRYDWSFILFVLKIQA